MGSSDAAVKMKQSSIASWINPFQKPKYKINGPSHLPAALSSTSNSPSSRPPSAPPITAHERPSASSSDSEPAFTLERPRIVSSALNNPPKSTSPTPSLKRKRDAITNVQPTDAPSRRHITPVSSAIETLSEQQETPASSKSSGLSLSSHTPPTPSSLASPAKGRVQDRPIAIRSSPAVPSSQNRSFVVQSSQSDERVDSEEEFEEGDNGDETITADDAPPSEPAPQALSCAKPTTQDLDGDSDSDSSLEDLDAMLNRTQRTQERLPSPPATTSARSRRTGVFKGSYDVPQTFENILNKTNDTPAAKATPTPSCRYSLAKLVKQHKKDEQRRTAMEEAEAATLARKRQAEAIDVIVGNVDKNVLASVMKREDEEESSFSKVLQALERADVMTKQVEYSFFARDLDVTELPHPGELRLEGLPPDAAALFEDESARNECFLNGFAAELAMMDVFMKLDRQRLREWLPVAAMWEPREDLSQAYLRTSKTLTTHCDFARWMRPYPVEVMFQACGATSYKVDVNHRKHITPTHAPSCKASDNQRSRILRTLHVLEQITQSLLPDTLSYTCEILARLATDTQVVKKDVEVQVALQRALAAMFEQIQTDRSGDQCIHDIATSTYKSVWTPILQQHILSNVPCTTPRLAHFRRRLALAFFLDSSTPLAATLHSDEAPTTLSRVIATRFRTHPDLQITPDADYSTLSALITLLDTGIGPGFSPSPELLRHDDKSVAAMAAKAAHNETIDALIAPVTALIARINDCGASHMARTDAKGVLERFVQRLNFCVRTVPRRRGGRGAWLMEAEQGRLDGFFGSMRQAAVEGVKVESGLADGVELEGKEEIKKENEIKEERGV